MAEIGFGNQSTCADALALPLMIGLAGLRVLAPARSLKISRENTKKFRNTRAMQYKN
jgi:hypothetical protein